MAYHPGYSFDWETGSYWPSDQKAYDAYMLAHPDVLKKTNKEGGFPYYGKF